MVDILFPPLKVEILMDFKDILGVESMSWEYASEYL